MKNGGKEWWVGNLKGGVGVEEGGRGGEAIVGGGCCRSEFGSGFLGNGPNRDSLSHLQRSFMHI